MFQADEYGGVFRKRGTLLSARGTGQQPSGDITSCHLGETPGLSGQGKHADFFYFTLYLSSIFEVDDEENSPGTWKVAVRAQNNLRRTDTTD